MLNIREVVIDLCKAIISLFAKQSSKEHIVGYTDDGNAIYEITIKSTGTKNLGSEPTSFYHTIAGKVISISGYVSVGGNTLIFGNRINVASFFDCGQFTYEDGYSYIQQNFRMGSVTGDYISMVTYQYVKE